MFNVDSAFRGGKEGRKTFIFFVTNKLKRRRRLICQMDKFKKEKKNPTQMIIITLTNWRPSSFSTSPPPYVKVCVCVRASMYV